MPEKNLFQDPTNYSWLGSSEDAQNKVFGEYVTSDMSDKTQLAYTALMKAQEQAFTTAMYNYNNWYNSDAQRMKRRLAAGLNPYGLEGSPASSAPSAPSSPSAPRSSGLQAKQRQQTLSAIDQLIGLADKANQMYELITYRGPSMLAQAEASQARSRLSDLQGSRLNTLTPLEAIRLDLANNRFVKVSPLVLSNETARNDWLLYEIYGPGFGPNSSAVESGFRAQLQAKQIELMDQRIEQLKTIINDLYPSEVQRNKALTALDRYREKIMSGTYDAVLDINTGNGTADSFLKFLLMLTRDVADNTSFGFRGLIR